LDHAVDKDQDDLADQASSVFPSSSSTPSSSSSSLLGKHVVVGDKLVLLTHDNDPPASDVAIAPRKADAWVKGTGYGRSSSSKWNTKQFHTAQGEKDRLHRDLLLSVRKGLCEVFLKDRSDSASSCDSSSSSSSTNTSTSTAEPIESLENTFNVVADSCLVPLLEELLGNESFVDMERHKDIYVSAYRIVELIASSSVLFPLLWPLKRQEVSLMTLLERKHNKLDMYIKADASAAAGDGASGLPKPPTKQVLSSKVVGEAASAAPPVSIPVPKAPTIASDEPVDDLFLFLHTVSEKVITSPFRSNEFSIITRTPRPSKRAACMEPNNNKKKTGTTRRSCGVSFDGTDAGVVGTPEEAAKVGTKADSQESLQKQYKSVMSAMQYDELDTLYQYSYAHHLPTSSTAKRRKRVRQEHYDLQGSLPMEWSSSVWVRYRATRFDTLQALISGPDDTPYSNGLFLFDVLFPEAYPTAPPKVTIQTTGGGTVRFNPNLYNNGKVCLSLLGTWSGSDGETWDEKTSTLLQVLVSIQSLILVPDPYFNEPGYEGTIATAKGIAASNKYNMSVRTNMVRWAMLDHLQHPKVGYEEITRTHFRMKAREIKAQFEAWRADSTTQASSPAAKARLESAMADVSRALDKLV
jgi:baculoviral IAP repeat-containing protein 6